MCQPIAVLQTGRSEFIYTKLPCARETRWAMYACAGIESTSGVALSRPRLLCGGCSNRLKLSALRFSPPLENKVDSSPNQHQPKYDAQHDGGDGATRQRVPVRAAGRVVCAVKVDARVIRGDALQVVAGDNDSVEFLVCLEELFGELEDVVVREVSASSGRGAQKAVRDHMTPDSIDRGF